MAVLPSVLDGSVARRLKQGVACPRFGASRRGNGRAELDRGGGLQFIQRRLGSEEAGFGHRLVHCDRIIEDLRIIHIGEIVIINNLIRVSFNQERQFALRSVICRAGRPSQLDLIDPLGRLLNRGTRGPQFGHDLLVSVYQGLLERTDGETGHVLHFQRQRSGRVQGDPGRIDGRRIALGADEVMCQIHAHIRLLRVPLHGVLRCRPLSDIEKVIDGGPRAGRAEDRGNGINLCDDLISGRVYRVDDASRRRLRFCRQEIIGLFHILDVRDKLSTSTQNVVKLVSLRRPRHDKRDSGRDGHRHHTAEKTTKSQSND
jgi:hypothetical protein